jgi:NADPH:quinone reductase-like Zn-dependent oxidoreductase
MGMNDYKLSEKLLKLMRKKAAIYKLTWMQPDAEQLNTISRMVEDGDIKPIIDLIYSIEDAVDAYIYLAKDRAKGKVIISLA